MMTLEIMFVDALLIFATVVLTNIGNNWLQGRARKEVYREKVIDKLYEVYLDILKIMQEININCRIYVIKPSEEALKEVKSNASKLTERALVDVYLFADDNLSENIKNMIFLLKNKDKIDNEIVGGVAAIVKATVNSMRTVLGVKELSNIDELIKIYEK